MTRNELIVGPAKCTLGAASWFTKDDISVSIEQDSFNIETSPHGKIDERAQDAKVEVSMTPEGRWTAAMIAALWGKYDDMVIGTSIFGQTDVPLVINGSDAAAGKHTLICAAVTKLPEIILSATKTMLGGLSVTGIRGQLAQGQGWSTDSKLYTIGASDGIEDATFVPADIVTQPYNATWTGTGFTTAFQTEDGWQISFDLQTEPRSVDSVGVIDYKFKSIGIMAKCVPIEPTAAQILAALKVQGSGAARGRSFATGAGELAITGASTGVKVVSIPLANLKTAGYRFGSTVLRNNEIGFVGARPFSAGVPQALYTIAAS